MEEAAMDDDLPDQHVLLPTTSRGVMFLLGSPSTPQGITIIGSERIITLLCTSGNRIAPRTQEVCCRSCRGPEALVLS